MIRKGATVYISAAELEALGDAAGLLTAQLEAASDPSPEFLAAHQAVYSLLAKARTVRRREEGKAMIRDALRAADKILGTGRSPQP